MLDAAAVLFVHAELPVLHLQGRLQAQKIGPQRADAGAASALPHVFQRVQDEAGLDLFGQITQVLGDVSGGHPPVAAGCPLDGQQADAGGEHTGVHDLNPAQLRRRHARGIVGVGEFGADVQMDHRVSLLRKRGEEVDKLLHSHGRGLRQRAVLAVAGIHVQRREALTVLEGILTQRDGQRNHMNIVALQQIPGQVAGAVGGNYHRFRHSNLSSQS